MDINDKRAHSRKLLHTDAWIADLSGNTWSQVGLLDISGYGVAFICAEPQIIGSSRMFRFHLPGNTKRIVAVCKITHNTPHAYLPGYRVGVEFARIDADDALLIEQFIANTIVPKK